MSPDGKWQWDGNAWVARSPETLRSGASQWWRRGSLISILLFTVVVYIAAVQPYVTRGSSGLGVVLAAAAFFGFVTLVTYALWRNRHGCLAWVVALVCVPLVGLGFSLSASPRYRNPPLELDSITVSLTVEPTAIVGADDEAWFVSESDGSLWHVTKSGSVSNLIHLGGSPVDLTSPDVSGLTWVVMSDQDRVIEVDTKTGSVVASVSVGHFPSSEATDFLAGSLWVANAGDDTITRIDPVRHAVTGAAIVGHQPVDIAFAGGDVWVANAGDDSVTVVDPSNLKRLATIRLGQRPTGISIQIREMEFLTPTEFKVWVTTLDGSVTEIDGPSRAIERNFPVGVQPRAVATVQEGVVVANEGSNSVSVIDLSGRHVFRGNHNVYAGVDPVSVSWWIHGHFGYFDTVIWVADKAGKTITVMAGFGAN